MGSIFNGINIGFPYFKTIYVTITSNTFKIWRDDNDNGNGNGNGNGMNIIKSNGLAVICR